MVGEQFSATCNGLSRLDVQLALYPDVSTRDGQIRLDVDAVSTGGSRRLTTTTIEQRSLAANQWIGVAFKPVDGSRGQSFILTARSTSPGPAPFTLWASSHVEVPGTRRFENADTRPGTLTIRASCDETVTSVAASTIAMIRRGSWLWPVAVLLCLIPGLGLAGWTTRDTPDLASTLGRAAGWSVMIAPLALAVASTAEVGGAAGPVALVGGSLAVVAFWWRHRISNHLPMKDASESQLLAASGWKAKAHLSGPAIVAIVGTVGAAAVRAAVARNLTLPMWVDSIQHSYIAQLIVESGGVPVIYGSAMPTEAFDYHFGFHAIAAAASVLAGSSIPMSILATGQVLGFLMPLATYVLAKELLGTARSAGIAALLVGVVTTQPTYLVTWGRYPELAGLVALPAAFAALRNAADCPRSFRTVAPAIAAGAAMPLVHPRVAVFLVALTTAYLIVTSIRANGKAIPRALRTGALGVASAALIAPWLLRLWQAHHAQLSLASAQRGIDFPFGLVTAGDDRYVLALALGGLAMAALLQLELVALFAIWAVLVLIAANPASFGLPFQLWINNDSLAIALFMPATILAGYAIDRAADLAQFGRWPRIARSLAGIAVVGAAFTQLPALLTVVNPCCYIGKAADLAAMEWIRTSTPADARFLVNGYEWSSNIWSGSDAGYWLPVLARRQTTLPPLFYATGPSDAVDKVNATAARIEKSGSDPAQLLDAARVVNAHYVYVGTQGGPIDPFALASDPRFRLLYRAGGAWVFEVDGGGASSSTSTGTTPAEIGRPSNAKAAGLRSTTSGYVKPPVSRT
jgi:hypothetical protein